MPIFEELEIQEEDLGTPEQRSAPVVCEVCGEPRTDAIAPCGHGMQNVRKCE